MDPTSPNWIVAAMVFQVLAFALLSYRMNAFEKRVDEVLRLLRPKPEPRPEPEATPLPRVTEPDPFDEVTTVMSKDAAKIALRMSGVNVEEDVTIRR